MKVIWISWIDEYCCFKKHSLHIHQMEKMCIYYVHYFFLKQALL